MHGKGKFVEVEGGASRRRRHRRRAEVPRPRLGRPPWQLHDRKPWFKAPRRFRNELERQFRARVRRLMAHGRFDDLPTGRLRNADWLWS